MKQDGFTLMETLVALSVFSLAAVSLATLTSQSVAHAGTVNARTLAAIAADNRLAAYDSGAMQLGGAGTGEVRVRRASFKWTETFTSVPGLPVRQLEIVISDPVTGRTLARRTRLVEAAP